MPDTIAQFEQVISVCRSLFSKTLQDYGPSSTIMLPSSLTDQNLIKANRIRSPQPNQDNRAC